MVRRGQRTMHCHTENYNDGPALLMSKEDHALTRSFAGRGKATMKEDIGLSARQRMAKDLWDIKNK